MEEFLPLFFISVMGLSLLIYIVLDGYDLGIGLLLPFAPIEDRDMMIASIGPFWDANETWIVLGIGILLIAFPSAHGMILSALYLPVTLMLIGLVLRGVAFDLRVKVNSRYKNFWNYVFSVGSFMAATCQGWMLGSYIVGLDNSNVGILFSITIAMTLPALYAMLGCGWLFVKTTDSLYEKAGVWGRRLILPVGLGLFLISIATPIASETIADKWFTLPAAIGLLPIPLTCIFAFLVICWILHKPDILAAGYGWIVFICMVVLCLMMALGLAYSIYPDVVIGRLGIWESAASTASLRFVFYGTALALPMIIGYTIFVYKIFHGKSQILHYD